MSLSVYQKKVRLPHTCVLPDSFATLPEEERLAFLEEYLLVSQQEYDLRVRVASGDQIAWKHYQYQINEALALYLQQHCPQALPYGQEIENRLWSCIRPKQVAALFGDALIDLVEATINMSLLIATASA